MSFWAFMLAKGTGTARRAYGHEVTLTSYLHEPADTAGLLTRHGLTIAAQLTREPRPIETQAQAFILARRSSP
jgi:hypothetical protein